MALVLLLQRTDADPGIAISIEKFDDITFHSGEDVLEQLQTKHVTNKNLTDSSVDLWKTLRIWSNQFRRHLLDPRTTNLILLTTAEAPPGSAAYYLRLQARNLKKAQEILEEIASKSVSASNKPAYEEFRKLSASKRSQLIRSIYVLDRSPEMLKVSGLLNHELRLATKPSNVSVFATRLEGWWLRKAVDHLAGIQARITAEELQAQLQDLREQFKLDNLPIDYGDVQVPASDSYESRRFVRQLAIIELNSNRIGRAILDYYRAVKQRSRWIGDHLVTESELTEYERRLVEGWAEIFESMLEAKGTSNEQTVGRAVYDRVMIDQQLHLRPSCTEMYVMKGSYHMLADGTLVGWHPRFSELLGGASK